MSSSGSSSGSSGAGSSGSGSSGVKRSRPSSSAHEGPSTGDLNRVRLRTAYVNRVDMLLDETIEGQVVLASYDKHGKLDNSMRDVLVKCTVMHLFHWSYNIRIDTSTLRDYAKQIIEVFPSEAIDTYFHTYVKRRKTIVGGRLVVKYHNLRRKLISVGLIHSSVLVEELEAEEGLDYGTEIDLDEDEDLRWLTSNVRPWRDVLTTWERTYITRMSIVSGRQYQKHINEDDDEDGPQKITDVITYLMYFRALTTPNGWELMVEDFNKLHPNLTTTLTSEWPTIIEFAKSKLGSRASKFLDSKDLTDDQKATQLLCCFNSLFKIRNVSTSKGTWRLSRLEIQRSFVLHAETEGAWKTIVNDRREHLKEHGLTLQPYLVFIGKIDAIKKYKLVYDSKCSWDLDSPLQALDCAFKLFFATCCHYPPECYHVWMFLQQAVYKIELPVDFQADKSLKAFLAADKKEFAALKL